MLCRPSVFLFIEMIPFTFYKDSKRPMLYLWEVYLEGCVVDAGYCNLWTKVFNAMVAGV